MTIRTAVAEDTPEIVAMAERFVAQTSYRNLIAIDPARVAETVRTLVAGSGAIFVAQRAGGDLVGMIALTVYDHPFSGDRVVSELAWWVEPGNRGRVGLWLLKRAEQWANEVGAVWLQMIAPTPEVEQMYERLAFVPIERSYQRRV